MVKKKSEVDFLKSVSYWELCFTRQLLDDKFNKGSLKSEGKKRRKGKEWKGGTEGGKETGKGRMSRRKRKKEKELESPKCYFHYVNKQSFKAHFKTHLLH